MICEVSNEMNLPLQRNNIH